MAKAVRYFKKTAQPKIKKQEKEVIKSNIRDQISKIQIKIKKYLIFNLKNQ